MIERVLQACPGGGCSLRSANAGQEPHGAANDTDQRAFLYLDAALLLSAMATLAHFSRIKNVIGRC